MQRHACTDRKCKIENMVALKQGQGTYMYVNVYTYMHAYTHTHTYNIPVISFKSHNNIQIRNSNPN